MVKTESEAPCRASVKKHPVSASRFVQENVESFASWLLALPAVFVIYRLARRSCPSYQQ